MANEPVSKMSLDDAENFIVKYAMTLQKELKRAEILFLGTESIRSNLRSCWVMLMYIQGQKYLGLDVKWVRRPYENEMIYSDEKIEA